MTDTLVAHRLGMTQRRYSAYVNETREPNFFDLLRICTVLGVTPDYVLGVRPIEPTDDQERRILVALRTMPEEGRALAVIAVEGMAGITPKRPKATTSSARSRRKA